jgi:hypothetical protein
MRALRRFWGPSRFDQWLAATPAAFSIRQILQEKLGKTGFYAIGRRLVASIHKEQIEQVFRLLGERVHKPTDVYVAGSIATLVHQLTSRPTDAIDFVDEVPQEIRAQRSLIQRIRDDYGLRLGHVQSHYLAAQWKKRRRFLGDFGALRVYLIDPFDGFVSKLSSKQKKHLDDLRVLAGKLDREVIRDRLLRFGKAFLDDPATFAEIEANWRFLFAEPAPSIPTKSTSESPSKTDQTTKHPRQPRRKPRKKQS